MLIIAEGYPHRTFTPSPIFSRITLTTTEGGPRRTFTPSSTVSDQSPPNVIAPGTPFSWICYEASDPYRRYLDTSSIVICTDGACPGNGTPSARAGLGVYFGPESPYNLCRRIEGAQTSQRAEIRAAVEGLLMAEVALQSGAGVRRVVVVSDSEYVVRGMTEWVFRWKLKGWKNSRGHSVVNAPDLQELDELIERLAEDGIVVEFWKVDRGYNTQADYLARMSCR